MSKALVILERKPPLGGSGNSRHSEVEQYLVIIRLFANEPHATDSRRYNRPRAEEVGAIITNNGDNELTFATLLFERRVLAGLAGAWVVHDGERRDGHRGGEVGEDRLRPDKFFNLPDWYALSPN